MTHLIRNQVVGNTARIRSEQETHHYKVFVVDAHTDARHKIGDKFDGGTVIDGTSDSDTDELLLVIRYGEIEERKEHAA
ncbi:MAG: hypothetical protein GY832_15315 [Chloroflexi bacterium]|nr:hypothetical protein [Chloroflexota bacterium]